RCLSNPCRPMLGGLTKPSGVRPRVVPMRGATHVELQHLVLAGTRWQHFTVIEYRHDRAHVTDGMVYSNVCIVCDTFDATTFIDLGQITRASVPYFTTGFCDPFAGAIVPYDFLCRIKPVSILGGDYSVKPVCTNRWGL